MDRGKWGSKVHLVTERAALSVSVGTSGANLHDSQALILLVQGIPTIRSRRGSRRRKPDKLHGDKGCDHPHLRRCLRGRGLTHRIARKGIEPSQLQSRYHLTVEHTLSWFAGGRRLPRRHEREADRFPASTGIACILVRCRGPTE